MSKKAKPKKKPQYCETCNGSGWWRGIDPYDACLDEHECYDCNGTGKEKPHD